MLRKLQEDLNDLKDILEIQGSDGNWNYDDYMLGLFNGMELARATVEGGRPKFRSLRGIAPIKDRVEKPVLALAKEEY